jgi:predicted HNH restriction endonuclease
LTEDGAAGPKQKKGKLTSARQGWPPNLYCGHQRKGWKPHGRDFRLGSRQPERDPKLREDALSIHGLDCMACGFNFERAYGPWGKGFIEVHHVVPLAEAGRSETNPATDLIVLCANCHRMVHRKRGVCLSLDELRAQIKR